MLPTKIFVGGLPPGSKPHELRRLFENFGIVTECDIMNRCGFVHMETPQMADTAIRALHNTQFKGSTLSVEPGRSKERNGAGNSRGTLRGNQRGGGGGGAGPPRRNYSDQSSDRQTGGSGGPVRRDRSSGSGRRNEPYNQRDRFQSSGSNRSFDNDQFNISAPSRFGGNDRYNDNSNIKSYGMGSQDKRGFALPDRSFNDNRDGRPMNQNAFGNFHLNRQMPSAGHDSYQSSNMYDSSSGNNFSRDGGRGGSSGGGGGNRGSYIPDDTNYNEAFPPLGIGLYRTNDTRRGGFSGFGNRGEIPRGGGNFRGNRGRGRGNVR